MKGKTVKICRGKESFWVIVLEKRPELKTWVGIIDNHLLNTYIHGLKFRDKIIFKEDEILDME